MSPRQMRHVSKQRSTILFVVLGLILIVFGLNIPCSAGGLQILRDDVRADPPEPDDEPSDRSHHRHKKRDKWDDYCDDEYDDPVEQFFADVEMGFAITKFCIKAASSPLWLPRQEVGDDGSIRGFFSRYPYQNHGSGQMMFEEFTSTPRNWSARFRSDYSTDCDDLSRIGGRLLLSTSSRWGIDTEMNYLQERLPADRWDHLWMGDCNVVYRFAQSERSQWRVGVGFNWLDDPVQTDYGFNLTYGFDFFPCKPLVFSSEIDWGTLGSAGAFHFRTTAGVLIKDLETFIGYEYRDIGSFQFNGLIAGLQVWF